MGAREYFFQSILISLISLLFRIKMNSLAFLLLLATTLSAVSADIDDIIDVHNGNANDYADKILKNLRVKILNEGLDPLILPVKSYEFSKKILLVEVRGSAKIYDGYLKGLSTLHRTGLADMNTNATHVTVRATIGVNDLAGSYKASAKFMNFGPFFRNQPQHSVSWNHLRSRAGHPEGIKTSIIELRHWTWVRSRPRSMETSPSSTS